MHSSASLIFLFIFILSCSAAGSDPTAELLSLQSQSPSGVIRLDDLSVSRFLTSHAVPRPYSLVIFFDAVQLHYKPELHLPSLAKEFALLATSFIGNNRHDPVTRSKLFFCDIEFKQSQSTFALFGVTSLPHIRLVTPDVTSLKDSHQMDQTDFSGLAESMAEFIEFQTKLIIGPVTRPPVVSKLQLGLLLVAIVIYSPFTIKTIAAGDTLLHDRKVWLIGSIFVYFFSVAGTMHNIIRKMPMFLSDPNDPLNLMFFYQGSGMQLGVEGFVIGVLYTIVGVLMSLMTHGLVKVRNIATQRFLMLVALFIAFWAVKKVIYLNNWKTGYGVHGFWPSSW